MGSRFLQKKELTEPSEDREHKDILKDLRTRISRISLKREASEDKVHENALKYHKTGISRINLKITNLDSIVSKFRKKDLQSSGSEMEEVHQNLLTYTPPEGWVEVERYWTDKPYSFVSILENPDERRNAYRIIEPTLTNFEFVLLEDALAAYEQNPADVSALATAFDTYAEFYRNHMILEEREILPLLRKHFTAEDWAEIDAELTADGNNLGTAPGDEFAAIFSKLVAAAPAPIGLGQGPYQD